MAARIVTIGDLTADVIMPVRFPIQPGDSQEMPWMKVEPGAAGNFLIAGQRIGGQMFACGMLGGDLFGAHVLNVLHEEGINVAGVQAPRSSTTTVVAVLLEPGTEHFSYIWKAGHSDVMPVSEPAQVIIDNADALFMQGYTLCEPSLRPLLDYAYVSGKPLWFDVGPASKDASQEDRALARRRAYAIMATESELPLIALGKIGQEAAEFIMQSGQGGPQLLVVKRGAEGCRVYTRDNVYDVPGFKVEVRDLVAAGDCFNAAFIYASLTGLHPIEAAIIANAAGAAKIQNVGTGRAMPTRKEIEAVLAANDVDLEF